MQKTQSQGWDIWLPDWFTTALVVAAILAVGVAAVFGIMWMVAHFSPATINVQNLIHNQNQVCTVPDTASCFL